jgi:hypothetical protein
MCGLNSPSGIIEDYIISFEISTFQPVSRSWLGTGAYMWHHKNERQHKHGEYNSSALGVIFIHFLRD